jgi:hypothetical protein
LESPGAFAQLNTSQVTFRDPFAQGALTDRKEISGLRELKKAPTETGMQFPY